MNKEEKREYMRKYRIEHAGEIREQTRAYRLENRERDREQNNSRSRAWRAANPEKRRAISARYRQSHPGVDHEYYLSKATEREKERAVRVARVLAERQARAEECKLRSAQYHHQHYLNRKEELRERSRSWYATHAEYVSERARQYHLKNAERIRERARAWARKHPDQRKAYEAIRRSRKLQNEGRYVEQDVRNLLKKQGGKCANLACRKSLRHGYHIDHVIPISRGGTNWPENLQLLCPTCNLRKADKPPENWARENELLFC